MRLLVAAYLLLHAVASSISEGTVLGFLGFGVVVITFIAVVDCVVVGCFCVAYVTG